VEDILEFVKAGKIRVPHFQRALRWRSSHVVDLFDSIYKGMPIGVLLFGQESREAETVQFGPLTIDAGAAAEAWVVIDGQQRVAALAAAMMHPAQQPRGDVFAIWFDLENGCFDRLKGSVPPPTWIPLNVVGDSARLLHWLESWPYRNERRDLVDRAISLSKTLREYHVPTYVVEDASEQSLRLIFKRINTAGVGMKESEVFDALWGTKEDSVPEACGRLAAIGFGQLNAEWFLRCLRIVEGFDPRRGIQERDKVNPDSVRRTERALGRTLRFLMNDAGIQHQQVLPYRLPLIVLSRFFDMHPEPEPRNLLRLRWWVWRGAMAGIHAQSNQVNVRAHQQALDDDESATVTRLLAMAPASYTAIDVRRHRISRSAAARMAALAMLNNKPWNAAVEEPWTPDAYRASLSAGRTLGDLLLDVANRKDGPIAGLLIANSRRAVQTILEGDEALLSSHAITPAARDAAEGRDFKLFDELRAASLDPVLERFLRERAGVDENPRPPIRAIVRQAAELMNHG
jgi:hypothetical protein